jgi:hypothetical protein
MIDLLRNALIALEELKGDARIINELRTRIELHDNFNNSEELIRTRIETNQGMGIEEQSGRAGLED